LISKQSNLTKYNKNDATFIYRIKKSVSRFIKSPQNKLPAQIKVRGFSI